MSEGDVVRLLRERGPLVSSALSAAFRAQARAPAPSSRVEGAVQRMALRCAWGFLC